MDKKELALQTIKQVQDRILPLIEESDIKNKLEQEFNQLKESVNQTVLEDINIKKQPHYLHVFNTLLPIYINKEYLYEEVAYQLANRVSLHSFKEYFYDALENHQEHIERIKETLTEDDFTRKPLLMGEFWPTEETLLIDGLKEYSIWEANMSEETLPYYVVNADMIIKSQYYEIDQLLLIIIRETYIAQEYAYLGESDFPLYYMS